jgi:hypothetical protein
MSLLPVVLGIVARVDSVNGQKVALITELVRADPDDPIQSGFAGSPRASDSRDTRGRRDAYV